MLLIDKYKNLRGGQYIILNSNEILLAVFDESTVQVDWNSLTDFEKQFYTLNLNCFIKLENEGIYEYKRQVKLSDIYDSIPVIDIKKRIS